jgi:hypothetical protein
MVARTFLCGLLSSYGGETVSSKHIGFHVRRKRNYWPWVLVFFAVFFLWKFAQGGAIHGWRFAEQCDSSEVSSLAQGRGGR